jgi:hypothetical protein
MRYNEPYGAVADSPYINGDPSIGRAGSIPPAASIEYPQRELVNLITDSGVTPDNADLHQTGKSIQNGKLIYSVDSGTANHVIISLVPTPLSYGIGGFTVRWKMAVDNTGATDINVNSMGVKSIKNGSGNDPPAGTLQANSIVTATYDGTIFQISSVIPPARFAQPKASITVSANASYPFGTYTALGLTLTSSQDMATTIVGGTTVRVPAGTYAVTYYGTLRIAVNNQTQVANIVNFAKNGAIQWASAEYSFLLASQDSTHTFAITGVVQSNGTDVFSILAYSGTTFIADFNFAQANQSITSLLTFVRLGP